MNDQFKILKGSLAVLNKKSKIYACLCTYEQDPIESTAHNYLNKETMFWFIFIDAFTKLSEQYDTRQKFESKESADLFFL